MAADCFPPPAFARTEAPIGGMSIDMTVHVHRSGFRLPDDGWLVGSFEIDDSAGGLAVEHGRLTLTGRHRRGRVVPDPAHRGALTPCTTTPAGR